jgi:hypothetical protein
MEKGIFMGYPEGFKAWKFYNPVTKRVTSPYVYIRLVLRPSIRRKIQWDIFVMGVLPTVSNLMHLITNFTDF